MLFAQYMVLKKGSLLLCLFTFHQKMAPSPIFYTCYRKILLAENNLNFWFCLEIFFCVKVYFTL